MTEELKLKHYLCDAFFLMKALHPFIPAFIPAKYLLLQAVVAVLLVEIENSCRIS